MSSTNTSSPLVSVIMPAFNAGKHLRMAATSVLSQTYQNLELLIIDDASEDDTLDIALDIKSSDSRVHVLESERNSGVADARNKGLSRASGKYIAFLDSDDLWLPNKLEMQISHMDDTNVSICYAAYQRIDEQGNNLGEVWPPQKLDYNKLLLSNFIGNLTGIYDAEILGKEYFKEFKHEDYIAWLSLVKRAGIATSVNEILGKYRVYSGSTSSNKLRTISWQWKIYRETQNLGVLNSVFYMTCYAYFAIVKRL